jgi:hypothetical protein
VPNALGEGGKRRAARFGLRCVRARCLLDLLRQGTVRISFAELALAFGLAQLYTLLLADLLEFSVLVFPNVGVKIPKPVTGLYAN